jgi:hypothetical protein
MTKDPWDRLRTVACASLAGDSGMAVRNPIVTDGERTFVIRDVMADPLPNSLIGPDELRENLRNGTFLPMPEWWSARRGDVVLVVSNPFIRALGAIGWSRVPWAGAPCYSGDWGRLTYRSQDRARDFMRWCWDTMTCTAERMLASGRKADSADLLEQAVYACTTAEEKRRCLLLSILAYEDDDVRHDLVLQNAARDLGLDRKAIGEAALELKRHLRS